jgi:hypothetical protein
MKKSNINKINHFFLVLIIDFEPYNEAPLLF